MSEDWDSVTRIGSKARGPGAGGADRERVIRGSAALNAAQRMGNVTSERKYGGANQVANTAGQRLTKVDREDDVVKTITVPTEVSDMIKNMRQKSQNPAFKNREKDMTRSDLAQACSVRDKVIEEFETGSKKRSDPDYQKTLGSIERALNVKLTGKNIGQPKFPIRD